MTDLICVLFINIALITHALWLEKRRPWALAATLVEMSRDGRDVLAVRFDLDRPLDDPGLLFMQWDGETFRPIDLAALPAGESATLADTSDVWASMW